MDRACPNCKEKTVFLFETKDLNRKVSAEKFLYRRCSGCGLIFLEEAPRNLSDYYKNEYYEIPPFDRLKNIANRENCRIRTIQKFLSGGRLLEIGPAFGVFAFQAKDAGFSVDVVEMDKRCCDYLSGTVGVNVVQSDKPHDAIERLPKHDVIALWHVIEHLPEPWACLEAAAKNLNDEGILAIATPNPGAFQFRLMGASWPHIDAPRHLWLFPEKVFSQRLKLMGLEPVMSTMTDKEGLSWNCFGWQRYIMNNFKNPAAQKMGFILGYLINILMKPWENRRGEGTSYTIVFRKKAIA